MRRKRPPTKRTQKGETQWTEGRDVLTDLFRVHRAAETDRPGRASQNEIMYKTRWQFGVARFARALPRLCLGKHCRSSARAAAVAGAAASSDDWLTGSLRARAIPGTLKKQLTPNMDIVPSRNMGLMRILSLHHSLRMTFSTSFELYLPSFYLEPSDICYFEEGKKKVS